LDAVFDFEIAGKGNVIQVSLPPERPHLFIKSLSFLKKSTQGVPYTFYSHFFSNTRLRPYAEKSPRGDKVKAAALIMFTPAGGSPYLYYGDEIGQREGFEMIGDAQMRNPMWWDGFQVAGFTTNKGVWTIKMKEEYYTNVKCCRPD
jgi:glycosidase